MIRTSHRRLMQGSWLPPLLVAVAVYACASAPSRASELAVRRIWEEYLASKKGQFARFAGEPSDLWDVSEQQQWPMYDLAGFYLADGAIPEVLSVTPVNPRADTAYQIVTRFWPEGTTSSDSSSRPELTMTVNARREQGRWVLANALPYKTSSWTQASRGRITFRVAPPPRLDYYVTESVDQALEVLGVVVPQRFGAAGGFAKPVNFQVFSGIPALGEEYRHEIAHVVLLLVIRGSGTALLASEGVPTWFGGTAVRDYKRTARQMDSLLTARPEVTLDTIVDDTSIPYEIRRAAGAVLAELVHEAGGVAAVREYLRTPGRGMREVLVRLLARPWPEVVAAWRARVDRIAAT